MKNEMSFTLPESEKYARARPHGALALGAKFPGETMFLERDLSTGGVRG